MDSIEAKKNKEGGIDLFAVLEPNGFYRDNIDYGQRLFTSIELMPDFAKTGEWYLVGLAATDNPASLGTQEVKFNQVPAPDNCYSAYISALVSTENSAEDSAEYRWLKKLFSKFNHEVISMSSIEYQELSAKLEAIELNIREHSTNFSQQMGVHITELGTKLSSLAEENAMLTAENTQQAVAYAELDSQFKVLQATVTHALLEQPGTHVSDHSSQHDYSVYA